MPNQGAEVSLALRHAIVTCRVLSDSTFDEIERKTGIQSPTASKIMLRATERAGCNDFQEVLACVSDMERSGRMPRVVNGIELSSKICNATVVHNDLTPKVEVPGKKKNAQTI